MNSLFGVREHRFLRGGESVFHSATHGLHWTLLGVAGADVSNQFPLDAVILGCEQEADKVGLSKHGVGHRCGVVGLLYNE